MIELVSQLKADMPSAFFIVTHLSKKGMGDFLLRELQPFTSLVCCIAKDASPIEAGKIYLAPSNGHLLVKDDRVIIGHGPEENRWRPSIDALFRSAAAAFSTRVIGIILTGFLSDGTSGMLAIRRSGGICIVQDPGQAEYPDMPMHVLNRMEVDHTLPLEKIGEVLSALLSRKPIDVPAPPDVVAEAEIAEKTIVGFESVKSLGEKSVYACPDCGGGLWRITENGGVRYRCHIGHSYGEKDLLIKQGENVESTLWIALRIMEERSHLLSKIGIDHVKKGHSRLGFSYLERATELSGHVETLKKVLIDSQKSGSDRLELSVSSS